MSDPVTLSIILWIVAGFFGAVLSVYQQGELRAQELLAYFFAIILLGPFMFLACLFVAILNWMMTTTDSDVIWKKK